MKIQLRKIRAISILALGLMMALAFVPGATSAATVTSTDFQSQSFSKVVDWYDYVRQYAAANGFTPPNSTEHAYIYANYINVGGFQLFSAGLEMPSPVSTAQTIPLYSADSNHYSWGLKYTNLNAMWWK